MKLNENVCFVTGGAKGIGFSIANTLYKNGAKVIIADIDEIAGNRAARDIDTSGQSVFFIQTDVTQKESLLNAANKAKERFKFINTVVINAGISKKTDLEQISQEEWNQVIGINLTGSFLTAQAFITEMKENRNGNIIFISSGSAITGSGGGAHYASSKAAQHGLMRSIARDFGPYGIRVNAIAPRMIETDIFSMLYPSGTQERDVLMNKIPLNRFGQPDDISNAVAFLVSAESSYIHGQILLIDGGRTYSG